MKQVYKILINIILVFLAGCSVVTKQDLTEKLQDAGYIVISEPNTGNIEFKNVEKGISYLIYFHQEGNKKIIIAQVLLLDGEDSRLAYVDSSSSTNLDMEAYESFRLFLEEIGENQGSIFEFAKNVYKGEFKNRK